MFCSPPEDWESLTLDVGRYCQHDRTKKDGSDFHACHPWLKCAPNACAEPRGSATRITRTVAPRRLQRELDFVSFQLRPGLQEPVTLVSHTSVANDLPRPFGISVKEPGNLPSRNQEYLRHACPQSPGEALPVPRRVLTVGRRMSNSGVCARQSRTWLLAGPDPQVAYSSAQQSALSRRLDAPFERHARRACGGRRGVVPRAMGAAHCPKPRHLPEPPLTEPTAREVAEKGGSRTLRGPDGPQDWF